jgi:hypothetical protein
MANLFIKVVFNEMKGAMSSPSDQLYHQLAHHLFPKRPIITTLVVIQRYSRFAMSNWLIL